MAEDADILTLAEARSALRQGSSTADDTTIELLITAASIRIDQGVGPVVRRTITAETLDGEGTMLQLAHWPVVSVTSVVEDGTTLTSDQYRMDYEKGQLHRRLNDWDYPWEIGLDNIEVTYIAGRFASTATVDAFYKEGCRLLLRHLWRSEQWNVAGLGPQDFDVPQIAYPTYSVPKAVIDWFGGAWRDRGRGGFA